MRAAAPFAVLLKLLAAAAVAGLPPLAGEGRSARAAAPPEEIEFFERRIRPILAQECYACHSAATKREGGLALDTREAIRAGGASGPAVVPGQPEASLLLDYIAFESAEERMPKNGAPLDAGVIADLRRWIARGAVDPRDRPPTADELAADVRWEAVAARRARWWSFAPLAEPSVPAAVDGWSTQPVDRFLRAAQAAAGLAPTADAEPATVLRRLQYVLTGLPATPEELEAFERAWQSAGPDVAVAERVDALLASPHFGERWARHWMDWFRYSEGHGGQGDAEIERAFEYRDYLIRALNANVPYDQLLREHVAGDLLPVPRIDRTTGVVESRIGPAHFRFVEHGYFPVDAYDELVKFTDNQLDVVTKTFLGLTVSCARCHDHKFDAISQRDYYALFGILASARPAQVPIVDGAPLAARRTRLASARRSLDEALSRQWAREAEPATVAERLSAWSRGREAAAPAAGAKPPERPAAAGYAAPPAPAPLAETDLLFAWDRLRDPAKLPAEWDAYRARLAARRAKARRHNEAITLTRWDFRAGLPAGWRVATGTVAPRPAGELGLGVSAAEAVVSVLPAGVVSHALTPLEPAALLSPDFTIPAGGLTVRWAGTGFAWFRLAPQNYPLSGGPIYRQHEVTLDGQPHTAVWSTLFWKGERGTLHAMTRDTTSAVPQFRGDAGKPAAPDQQPERGSWFALAEARLLRAPQDRLQDEQFAAGPLLSAGAASPRDREELASRYAAALATAVEARRRGTLDDEGALLLTAALRAGLLSGRVDALDPEARAALDAYRALEDELPPMRSAPGVIESDGFDQPLLVRGNHRAPGEVVPRGFLAALGGQPYSLSRESGRLALAEELTRADNPLVPRVLVNRLWHYTFGRGLVGTPDNFGRTGELPTHPELLDYLAARFRSSGYDLKATLRTLLTSRAFRVASEPSPAAAATDPANRLWSHALVRRLDGEIVRDHLLAATGTLDPALYGPSVPLNLPPAKDCRRGVYLEVNRTRQGALMDVFDVPPPTTTRGARDVSITPAQAIALLNSPYVRARADAWGARAAEAGGASDFDAAVTDLCVRALGRRPTAEELSRLRAFFAARQAEGDTAALADVAHLVLNLKEFLFIR